MQDLHCVSWWAPKHQRKQYFEVTLSLLKGKKMKNVSKNRPFFYSALGAFLLQIFCCFASANTAVLTPVRLQFESVGGAEAKQTPLKLRGKGTRFQLLVSGGLADGGLRDCTTAVIYAAAPAGIVEVSEKGLLSVVGDGTAKVTASLGGHSTEIEVQVFDAGQDVPINFANQIVPIFTKASCNSGGCHGKSAGQNGFRLSLLGFEPAEDYEHLVKEARGRRLFPASPENSLLLTKGVASVPHGGGKRLSIDSDDYRLLLRWISQGMPEGSASDPKLAGLQVLPAKRRMALDGEQQLAVRAVYSDGSVQDVTRSALFEPNDKAVASTGEDGLVSMLKQPGDVAVMVRYQDKSAVFNATVPLGAPVGELPAPANDVDRLVFAKLREMGMPPSVVCDDATFLRRASVDIAGRLPSAADAEAFLADKSPTKRTKLVNTLLDSPEYADFFASQWSALLRNKRNKPQDAPMNFAFYTWLSDSLRANKPYDQLALEVLAASGGLQENPAVAWYKQVKEPQQQLEDTAQLFLGTRLQCAQCHHHPFEKWSQNDYYSFSAFFSQVRFKGQETLLHRRGVAQAINKKTKLQVKPAALGSGPMDIAPDEDPRIRLVEWMRAKENPFFARTLVNRYWKHFLNRGLVEPEDDMRDTNPPSNPELLDMLARRFTDSGFDLKALIRDITTSTTYQFSALPNAFNQADRQNFSRYYPKRLQAEVLYDSVSSLTRSKPGFVGLPSETRAISLPDNSFNKDSYFLTVFGRPESSSACACERTQDASLAQALHLLNAKAIQEKLAADTGSAAQWAVDKRGDDAAIRELYLSAYARQPDAGEFEVARAHLAKPRKDAAGMPLPPDKARRQAFEDILWVVLNTKEFLFNH